MHRHSGAGAASAAAAAHCCCARRCLEACPRPNLPAAGPGPIPLTSTVSVSTSGAAARARWPILLLLLPSLALSTDAGATAARLLLRVRRPNRHRGVPIVCCIVMGLQLPIVVWGRRSLLGRRNSLEAANEGVQQPLAS
jgi:hypothetical protein